MYCISINYKTAPVDVRALFALNVSEQEEFIKLALSQKDITECLVLCTCNRSEFYFEGTPSSIEQVKKQIQNYKSTDIHAYLKYLNIFTENQAIRHIFMVTCGLESMVLGEDEVLGQVKEAYQTALRMKSTSFILNTVFQNAITCAKKIKTNTGLSKTPVSIGTLVANEIFNYKNPNSDKKNVFIIGMSGKMGTIIMKNIYHKQNILITGTSRTQHEHITMQYPKLQFVCYKERYQSLNEADIIISATKSPHYTITRTQLVDALKTKKNRIFIDLAVPNDFDPDIKTLPNTVLYNIDYFEQLCKNNNMKKANELERGKDILELELDETLKIISFRNFLPEIPKIKDIFASNKFENILYKIRDSENHENFSVILKAFKKLAEEI